MNGRIAYESYLKKRWKVAEVDYEIDGGEIRGLADKREKFPRNARNLLKYNFF